MAGLGVVQSQAVEQDQDLAERGATNGKVGLDSVRRALLEIERRIELEKIEKRAGGEAQVLRVDDMNRPVGFFEGNWLPCSGNDDGLRRRR